MKLSFLVILTLFSNSIAQLTHTFTETARNTHYGNLRDIAVDKDGTIFLATGYGGLQVYGYNNISFNFVTRIVKDSCNAQCVTTNSKGTVFLAATDWNDNSQLIAYNYNGSTLNENARTLINGDPVDIAVGPDGNIYLANGTDGLLAYYYNGSTFTKVAHTVIDSGSANSIAIGNDGTVFCAITGVYGRSGTIASYDAGLYAYRLNDTSFTSIAHINDSGWAQSVSITKDGTVFLANGNDGLRSYRLNDSTFTSLAHSDIENSYAYHVVCSNDSNIFVSTDYGLWAYTYDDSLLKEISQKYLDKHYTDEIINDLVVDQTGLYIITNFSIAAYTYDGYTLIKESHSHVNGIAHKVTQGTDGTIFLANGGGGLLAYIYNGVSFIKTAEIKDGDSAECVALNSDGTIFVSYADHSLWAYKYNGTSFMNIAKIDTGLNAGGAAVQHPYNNIIIGANDEIFFSDHSNGLKVFEFNGNSFTKTAEYNYAGFSTEDGVVDLSGTLFLATDYGLAAFTYSDKSLNLLTYIEFNYGGYDVALSRDSTFFVSVYNGLRSFHFNGISFTDAAQFINYDYFVPALTVGPDGTVFVTNGDDGLHAFNYNGSSFTNIAGTASGSSGHDLIAEKDNTIFLANGNKGLIAYKFSKITSVDDNTIIYPENYGLKQNYPNPFNAKTMISYTIGNVRTRHAVSQQVDLSIYNLLGQKVATLVDKKQPAGNYHVQWDASGFASGVYLYKLQTASGFSQVRKLVLLK